METNEIVKQLQSVFRSVFDDEQIVLTAETTAEDIEDWDSLTHIQLVVAIEKTFHVKFTAREIMEWQNVGTIINSIIAKQ